MENELYRISSRTKKTEKMTKFSSKYPSILWLKNGTKMIYRKLSIEQLDPFEALLLPADHNHFYKLLDCSDNQELVIIELKEPPNSNLIYQSVKAKEKSHEIIEIDGSISVPLNLIVNLNQVDSNESTQRNVLHFLYNELADRGVLHHLFSNDTDNFTSRLYSYFKEESDQNHHIEDVCYNLGVSRATLTRKLKIEGTRYRDVLSDFRINKSIEMMESGRFSILDVAITSGFKSYDTFKKHFVRQVGMIPSKYYEIIKRTNKNDKGSNYDC